MTTHSNTPAQSGHFSPLPGDPINNRQFSIPIDNVGKKSLTIIVTNNTLEILVFEAIQMGKYSFKTALSGLARIKGIDWSIVKASDTDRNYEDLFWQIRDNAIELIYPNRFEDEPLLNQALFMGLEEVQL